MSKTIVNPRWQKSDPRYLYSLVVRRYFAEMKTKVEIAEELGVSRFKVARLIDDAIEQGYIKFVFPKQRELDEEMASNLCKKYQLKDAVVLPASETWSTQEQLNVKLGGITANYLSETLREDEIWYGLGKGIVQHSQPACVFTPSRGCPTLRCTSGHRV